MQTTVTIKHPKMESTTTVPKKSLDYWEKKGFEVVNEDKAEPAKSSSSEATTPKSSGDAGAKS